MRFSMAILLLAIPTIMSMAAVGAQQSVETLSCVDFGHQRIWLRGPSPETLVLPLDLGSVFVASVSIETGDSEHNGLEHQPGERVTATIGGAVFGPTDDIPDDDPTFRTQTFPAHAQLDIAEVIVTHAPVVAPDSVDVGLVCIRWTPTAPAASTTTTGPPSTVPITTTTDAATTTTQIATTTAPATSTTLVSGPTAVLQPPPAPNGESATVIEGAQQLAFTGSAWTLLMLAAGAIILDLGYMFWSSTRLKT